MGDVFADLAESLSETALAKVRADPRLLQAAEIIANGAVEQFARLEDPFRWILNDIGVGSIGIGALALKRSAEGLTAANLTAFCVDRGLASRGRVRVFLDRCLRSGEITVVGQTGPQTRRALDLRPGLIAAFRDRTLVELDGAILLDPQLAFARDLVQDDDAFLDIMHWVGVFSQVRPDILLNHPANPSMELFVHRTGGMMIVHHFVKAQRPGRDQLLEQAPVSRYALAQACGVSRLHVARLLADAEAYKLMTFPTTDMAVFTPKFSQALERQTAMLTQWLRAAVLAVARTRGNVQAKVPSG